MDGNRFLIWDICDKVYKKSNLLYVWMRWILEKTAPGAGNEIQLTDALKTLALKEKMLAYAFKGRRHDVGDKLGFLKATVEFALQRDNLKDDFLNYLEDIVRQHRG